MPATLESRFPTIIAELRPKVSAAVKASAEQIAETARENVPVGEPDVHLKDHIHVENTGAAEYAVVAGDSEVFYGHMVEFGTSHSAPKPFLLPATEEGKPVAISLVEAALRGL